MNRISCIHLPDWPLQRLVVARPELENGPLVLYTHIHPRGQQVVACSATARPHGVRPGLPLAEAQALLDRAGATEEIKVGRALLPVTSRTGRRAGAAKFEPAAPCLQYDPAADRFETAARLRLSWFDRWAIVSYSRSATGRTGFISSRGNTWWARARSARCASPTRRCLDATPR